jgi:SAM-dependent methyltransferase
MSTVAELYLAARGAEGRILGDAIVAELPWSGARTPHANEWRVREQSLKRVLRALSDAPHRVLEVGCGNGWFSARLAQAGHTVTGIDNGLAELDQARRVFAQLPISWVDGDPWNGSLPTGSFDTILFAASAHYFPDLHALFARCRELGIAGGGIIIVDTPFYADEREAAAARERSKAHYASIGVPAMAGFYLHHTRGSLIEAAGGARMEIIPPRGKVAALLLGRYPFPIVRIRP